MIRKRQCGGYTIFELTIVCLVATALLFFGLNFLHRKYQENKVGEMRQPIQQLLYAMNDYYQYRCVPDRCDETLSVTLDDLYDERYLDETDYEKLTENSYGLDFEIGLQAPSSQPDDEEVDRIYWIYVSATLSSEKQNANSKSIDFYRIMLRPDNFDEEDDTLYWYLSPSAMREGFDDLGQSYFKRLLYDETLSNSEKSISNDDEDKKKRHK